MLADIVANRRRCVCMRLFYIGFRCASTHHTPHTQTHTRTSEPGILFTRTQLYCTQIKVFCIHYKLEELIDIVAYYPPTPTATQRTRRTFPLRLVSVAVAILADRSRECCAYVGS